jgi:hypothetical protein
MNHAKLDMRTEDLIDAVGLSSLLESLVRVSVAKAEHINENWQDDKLATSWMKAAQLIETLLVSMEDL